MYILSAFVLCKFLRDNSNKRKSAKNSSEFSSRKDRKYLDDAPLAGEANNLKSQSQQEGMCLEAQVNLYNKWTPIRKSDVNFFFN